MTPPPTDSADRVDAEEGLRVPEGPVEEQGVRAVPMRVPPAGPENGPSKLFAGAVPRVVVKADLLPAVSVLSLLALLGLPLGWLWSRLAPPQDGTLTRRGDVVPLLVESYQRFDALAIFLLLSLAVGALSGSVLWMLRGRRGPVMLVAGAVGSLLAAWLAMQTGDFFAGGLYPTPPRPAPGDLIEIAPTVTTWWAVLAQPLALSIVYGAAASWNGLDDLGRRLG